jgi:hypothetical protein
MKIRWAKVVLFFQAAVTLILGIVFFSQLTMIGASDISNIVEELSSTEVTGSDTPKTIENIRARYTVASYVLIVVGLSETIIIARLFS